MNVSSSLSDQRQLRKLFSKVHQSLDSPNRTTNQLFGQSTVYADAGASWCMENVWPQRDFDGLHTSIRQGPPYREPALNPAFPFDLISLDQSDELSFMG